MLIDYFSNNGTNHPIIGNGFLSEIKYLGRTKITFFSVIVRLDRIKRYTFFEPLDLGRITGMFRLYDLL